MVSSVEEVVVAIGGKWRAGLSRGSASSEALPRPRSSRSGEARTLMYRDYLVARSISARMKRAAHTNSNAHGMVVAAVDR